MICYMPHVCPKCNKEFSQKGHLESHLNRKKTCEKCNVCFSTQYAYVNGKCVHVSEYKKNKGDKVKCQRGHELVMCQGSKVKKYFRHKHAEDVGGDAMSEWHSRMQSYFPVTEVPFKKFNEHQTKDRRADVFIKEQNYCVEIQHSKIDDANVICRHSDYSLHGVTLVWLIDGNTSDVIVEKLSTDNYLFTFNEEWKYKSFRHSYDYILVDVHEQIFKIPVKKVCNKMVLVKAWKPLEQVMNILRTNPRIIWDKWDDDNEIKAKMTVHQKGAGNGKTFGIWKSIAENLDKELFIIVTKQHSAKSVIKRELEAQAKRDEYHIVDNLSDVHEDERNRKYIVKYKHKHSNRKCVVIIGTIDSLLYNLVENARTNTNFFQGLLETIEEYGVTKVNKETGSFYYAGETLRMDKKTELWIDEAQDLNESYFKAIVRLMLETKIDVVIVGDKLQSLEYKDNFMTRVEEQIPNIDIIREPPVNLNRRIMVSGMADEINRLVHFEKYGLPSINVDRKEGISNPTLEILETPINMNHEENGMYVKTIIEKVHDEVEQHGYIPNDFLFVFPVMKSNLVAIELETKLNEYWIEKNGDNSEYNQYAMLHRHEEGQVIDTSLSDEASRIVSIRTSKGDGRKVVFVLGCTEAAIKLVSRSDKIDLIYDSYLHVALTRAKNKVYFGLTSNGDEIHQRFGSEGMVEYKPKVNSKLQHHKIIENINNEKIVELMKENGIKEPSKPDSTIKQDETKQVIDWEYHCIRRAIYLQYAVYNILRNKKVKKNFGQSQITTILNKISKLPVSPLSPNDFYKYINNLGSFDNFEDFFPLCNLSHKREYQKYTTKIQNIINKNNRTIKKDPISIVDNNPLEAVIHWYTVELYKRHKFCETKPTTIYSIVNHYERENETKITELMNESEKIKETTTLALRDIFEINDTIGWNIEHMVEMEGRSTDMNVWFRDIQIIGYGKHNVYHFMFQTDFNQLNFWDTMIKMMIERFIIFNAGGTEKNVAKFKSKPIITYLFILKHTTYEKILWDDATFSPELTQIIADAVIKHFCSFNTQLFQYCKFIKHSQKWKSSFKSPYDYIANVYQGEKTAGYVTHFFKMLHNKAMEGKEGKVAVKHMTDSEELFSQKITEHIEDMVHTFFGMNTYDDDSETELEGW